MPDQTINYGLAMPGENEFYDIAASNQNLVKIDAEIKAANNKADNKVNKGSEYNPNLLINGDFQIWQRGLTQNTSGYGSDDRWNNSHVGSTKTHSREEFTPGQTDVFGNPRYFSRTIVTSANSSSSAVLKLHRVEDGRRFSNKTVTLSFWAKANSNKNISVELALYNGISNTNWLPSVKLAITTIWTLYTVTINIPSIDTVSPLSVTDTCLEIRLWFDAGSNFNARTQSLGNQSGTFDIAMIKLEYGDHATPFIRRSEGEELSLCQRYYEKFTDFNALLIKDGYEFYNPKILFKVRKRIVPTMKYYASADNSEGKYSEYNSSYAWVSNKSIATSSGGIDGIYLTALGNGVNGNYARFTWDADAEL